MQESVTRMRLKRSKKSRLNAIIFTTTFFFIIFLICAILVVSKRTNLCFDPRYFYVVYAGKDKNESVLLARKEEIKKLGGAAVLFEKNNEFYVAVGVYNKKDDAKEIAEGLSEIYSDASVLEISCKGISGSERNLIKENQYYFDLFDYLYDFSYSYEKLCFSFAKGETSEGKFMSTLLADKLEIEKRLENCRNNKISNLEPIETNAFEVVSLLERLFAKFYSSTNKGNLCYEFYAEFVKSYILMCDNLQ